jgi:hypothetical protein
MQHPGDIEEILQKGARKARAISGPFLDSIRKAVGLVPIR